jgi:hypothetical protein
MYANVSFQFIIDRDVSEPIELRPHHNFANKLGR